MGKEKNVPFRVVQSSGGSPTTITNVSLAGIILVLTPQNSIGGMENKPVVSL